MLDEGLVGRDLIDRLERDRPPAWPEWEAFTRRAVERFHRPDEGISICPAPSGPQRCTDEMLAGSAALAEELDLAIHIHVLETRMQAVSAQKMYGETLPEHLAELGFLSPRVSFEHGIWLTPGDIELVAAHGVTIVHNPVSNMKLGSGICPVPDLLAAGVNVALGTDGMCSNDGNDMYGTHQDRGAAAQALGDRLRAVARRRRRLGDGDRERRRRRRRPGGARSHRTGPPGRPRAARPRHAPVHPAEQPAPPGRPRLDHARSRLRPRRRPLGDALGP